MLIGNQLTPAEISQLINLQRLDLRSNNFSFLPLEVTDLSNLQNLGLSENDLKMLPHEIGKLTNLQELYLRQNNLKSLPSSVFQLAQGFEHLKRDFSRLWNHQMANLNAECPNTFLIMPGNRSRFHPKSLFGEQYTLYLLCQHPPKPHMVTGEEGYPITLAEEWVAKLSPWLKQLIEYLRYIPN